VRGVWAGDFLEEACRFPQGKHDDQIDAVGLAVR
jgi:phage terminase large subunit-like protein